MTTLNQTAPSPPAASDDSADLLDALVEDHLQRTAGPFESDPPAENLEAAAPDAVTKTDVPSSLQQEIDALLAGTPSPTAPVEPALQAPVNTDDLSDEELAVLLPDLQEQISSAATDTPPAAQSSLPAEAAEDTGVTSAEMAALSAELENLTQEPPTSEASTPTLESSAPPPEAPAPAAVTEAIDSAEEMRQAEATLQKELENIMSGSAASATETPSESTPISAQTQTPSASAEASAQTEPVTFESAIPEATTTLTDPPVIIELLPTDKKLGPVRSFVHDISLLIAQLFDMPFHWIDTLDKNLLGFAAFLFLLSGLALMAASWWMNR